MESGDALMHEPSKSKNAAIALATVVIALVVVMTMFPTGGPSRDGSAARSPILRTLAGSNSTFPGNASTGCYNCQPGANDTLPPILASYQGFSSNSIGSSGRATSQALSGYSGHYWLFGEYAGASTTTNDVYASITLPFIGPRAGDTYFVEISIWDNAGHYDQIGVTSDFNSGNSPGTTGQDWNANWVNAPNCGATFNSRTWDPDAGSLGPGQSYTFDIHLGGGFITFSVYYGFGSPSSLQLDYSNSTSDSATSLLEQTTTTCGATTAAGYTVGEEVYNTTVQPFPNWDFNISNNHAGGAYVTNWNAKAVCDGSWPGACPVPTSPHGYYIWKMGWAFVEVANQAYSFQNARYAAVTAGRGQQVSGLSEDSALVGSYCLTQTCYSIGAYSLPTGWTGSVTFSSTLTSHPTVAAISFTVPGNAVPYQYYYLWIQLQTTPSQGGGPIEWTSMMLYVYVV